MLRKTKDQQRLTENELPCTVSGLPLAFLQEVAWATGALGRGGREGVLLACMSVVPTCMYARGGQKRAFNPLRLELQMIGSYHVDSVNWTQVIRKRNQYS